MAKKSTSTNPAKIPGARKTMFFKYGELSLRPHFALALQYKEALRLARGEENVYELMWGAGRACRGKAQFVALHRRVQALAIADGAAVIVELGKLLSEIDKYDTDPHSKDCMDIKIAYLEFRTDFRRPPAREELRQNLWMPKAVLAAEKKLGDQGRKAIDKLLRSVWKSKSHDLGAIMEVKRFKRAIKKLGLELFDGKLLERYDKRYKALYEKKGRKPTKVEYLSETQDITSKTRKPLKDALFHEFISFLANPIDFDPIEGWCDLSKLRSGVSEYLDKNTDSQKASDTLLFFDGITHLDMSLSLLRIGLLEGQEDFSDLKNLMHEYRRLADELNRLPLLEDVLIRCDPAKLSAIALEIEPRIEGVLTRMQCVLRKLHFTGAVPLAWLAKEIPEIKLLSKIFERLWMQFWPTLLWEKFNKS